MLINVVLNLWMWIKDTELKEGKKHMKKAKKQNKTKQKHKEQW